MFLLLFIIQLKPTYQLMQINICSCNKEKLYTFDGTSGEFTVPSVLARGSRANTALPRMTGYIDFISYPPEQ